jgi:O-antigen ligase
MLLQTGLLACGVLVFVASQVCPDPMRLPPSTGWFLLALCALSVSALRAPYGYSAALELVDTAAVVGMLVLAGMLTRDTQRRRNLARVILASAVFQTAVASWQWLAGGLAERPAGTLLNLNHLGAFLAVGILVGWGLMFDAHRRKSPREEALLAASLVIVHLGFFLPRSRGALAALVIGTLVLAGALWRHLSSWQRRGFTAAAVLVAIIGTGVLVLRLQREDDPYLWDRTRLWRASLTAAMSQPLLGLGPGQFEGRSNTFSPPLEDQPVRFGKRLHQTHSDWLRIFVEGGIMGGAAALLAFGALAGAIGRALVCAGRENAPFAAASSAAVAGLFTHAAVANLSERPALLLVGGALAGSAAALGRPAGGLAKGSAKAPQEARREAEPQLSKRGAPEARPVSLLLGGTLVAAFYLAAVLFPYLADASWRRSLADPGGGEAFLQRAIRLNPFQPAYHARAAALALRRGGQTLDPRTFAIAAGHLERARSLDPLRPQWAVEQAQLMRRGYFELFHDRSSLEASLRAYEEAERLGPISPFASVERATLAASVGDFDNAREGLTRATTIEPNFLNARLLRAKLELEAGHEGRARIALAEAERRRAVVSSYAPANRYETDILAWDEDLAASIRSNTSGASPSGTEDDDGPYTAQLLPAGFR